MLENLQFAVMDVETTGLYAGGSDRIVEIAVVKTDAHGTILSDYSTLVNPCRDIGPTHIHRISARDVQNAPLFDDIAGDVVSHLRGAVIVGHNITFDIRFLRAEFQRLGHELPDTAALCTMSLAKRVAPDLGRRRLCDACKRFGINSDSSHSARGDAMATTRLLYKCIEMCKKQGNLSGASLPIRGAVAPDDLWPELPKTGLSWQRSDASSAKKNTVSYLSRLVARLSGDGCVESVSEEYLALLDMVLDDRRITADEAYALLMLAEEHGLSRESVILAHRDYMRGLLRAAWEDRVITESERLDLEEVRRLLGISRDEFDGMIEETKQESTDGGRASSGKALGVQLFGKTVCFTGSFTCRIDGQEISRALAKSLAERAGMTVVSGCTKKTDFLVVADPDSMSDKAKKARQYGVRMVAEPVFWRWLGVSVE